LVDGLAALGLLFAAVVLFHAVAVTRALRDWVIRRLK
jgi:hypothetical protein